VRDTVAFLSYVGEPAQIQRHSTGNLGSAVFAGVHWLAWLLKKEYCKDVHWICWREKVRAEPGSVDRRQKAWFFAGCLWMRLGARADFKLVLVRFEHGAEFVEPDDPS